MGDKNGSSRNGVLRTRKRATWFISSVVTALVAVLIAACAPAGGGAVNLGQVKRSVYGQRAQVEASQVAAGSEHPIVQFTVQSTPPSIFVNYIIPDAQAADFASFIGLKPGFTLAKVKILESDPVPRYWLSLNVYRVTGITNGMRAEWSTYVDDGDGAPRFMIIKARAAEGSIDPIGPEAPPEPFQHALDPGDVINTNMRKTIVQNTSPPSAVLTPDNLFTSSIQLPAAVDRDYVTPAREWVSANDFIYWMNGVNDRAYHNATAHSAPLISVDVGDVTLDDDTDWVPYIDPVPGHVLVYLDKLEFTIAPWWNVTTTDGRVDAPTLYQLSTYKSALYGGFSSTHALNVKAGIDQPTVRSNIDASPPAVHWHWRIPATELAAFEAAIDLPAGLSLATVRLQEDDVAADNWLSLNVYKETGFYTGLRAEWTTYVSDGQHTRTIRIESRAGSPILDPVQITSAQFPYTPAYPVTHALAGSDVSTSIGSGPSTFTSTFTVPPPGPGNEVLASRELVAAGDVVYWRNGVYDKVAYGGTVFDPKISVDPGTVSLSDGSQWAPFVDPTPDRVWVDQSAVGLVTNPWWNR
jgi:hypothetical protein